MRAARVPALLDRIVWLRLPGSFWAWIWAQLQCAVIEELDVMADPLAGAAWPDEESRHESRQRMGRLLLALREVVRQAAPATFDQDVAESDTLQAEILERLQFVVTPAEEHFARALVINTDERDPAVRTRMERLFLELGIPLDPRI